MAIDTHVRISWQDLPGPIQERIEGIIGDGAVVEAVTQSGGFSPGTADRVRTADGKRAFVKAVSTNINPRSAANARKELHNTAALPAHAPVPRLLGGIDDGTWVVMVLEDVEGRTPGNPWTPDDLALSVAALRDLAATLTPSPLPGVPRMIDSYAGAADGWRLIAEDPPADLDPWVAANLPLLQATALRGLQALGEGDTLAHTDIRGDNLLVRPDGSIVVVDWPHAAVGPAWFDRLFLALNVVFCGHDPAPALDGIDPGAVLGVTALLAGSFLHMSRLPPPPGIPTVRAFAGAQAKAWLRWLRAMWDLGHTARE